MRLFLALLLCSCSVSGFCQSYIVSGKITNNRLEPLAFVSVQVKELKTGTVTKEDGRYELKLDEGKYDLVISMVGYKTQVITIIIPTKGKATNIIMDADESGTLSEVIVKAKNKDRAEEIVRMVIRNKENITTAAGPYSCHVYIKATQYDSSATKKTKKNKLADSIADHSEFMKMAMAEISLRKDYESEQRTKEERIGVKIRGNPTSLFYLSTTEGNFNLYNNLIKVPTISPVPFLSPISYSGLVAYKYKTLNIRQEGRRKIYTIGIKPTQLSNATIEGEIEIMDSAWVILKSSLRFPPAHLPEYDFFEVDQDYHFIDNKAWMVSREEFTYFSKTNKSKKSGHTVADFQQYELQKKFPDRYFGVEVASTSAEAYEKDSSFWTQVRTEPLTKQEVAFIHYKDSIYRATNTKEYLDSMDRVINKITLKKLFLTGQILHNHEKERTWHFPTIPSFFDILQFGGSRINLSVSYDKTYKTKKDISVFTDLSYGLRNKDVNGSIRVNRMYNPFNRGFYRIEVGREFEYIYKGDAWINMIKRSNFYLNNSIELGHGLELWNGLFLYTELNFALRRALNNYKTDPTLDSLLNLSNNQAVAFEPYNALYGKIRLSYTPRQKYIREPHQKVILGSKWPTFYVSYRKGIPDVFQSKVDFDYLEFGIEQQIHFGLLGTSQYTIKTGSFLNTTDLRLIDYQFQRRGDPVLFLNPQEAFQSLDSTFPLFHRFYQAHLVHDFNGALLSKIPFLNKLQLREVAGGGFLIAPERNLRYAELFAGIERVFKWPFSVGGKFKLGVYVVGSAANQFRNPVQLKFGITTWDIKNNKWF